MIMPRPYMGILAALIASALLVFPSLAAAGIWDRMGEALDAHGLKLSLIYDGDAYTNVEGGTRRGATYVGNLHLNLNVDAERLLGWTGANFFFYGLSIHGGHPSRFTGDAQGACNLEGPTEWKLEEAWLEQNLFDNRVSILAGLYDLNTEFYRLQSSGLFLNSSFGIGPEFSQSGIAGPSIFPHTSLGLRFAFKPARGVVFRAAVFDGAPLERPDGDYGAFKNGDGLLLVSELAFLFRPLPEKRPLNHRFRLGRLAGLPPYSTKIALGGWYYTAKFQDLSRTGGNGEPLNHRGSGGFYVLADKNLFQSNENPGRRLAGFVQLGVGDGRVNRFSYYAGTGLVAPGLFKGRGEDELGLAVAMAKSGSHFMDKQEELGAGVRKAEVAIELTYLLKVSEWLAIQPAVQYIISPNTDSSLKNALVFQLRFEVSL